MGEHWEAQNSASDVIERCLWRLDRVFLFFSPNRKCLVTLSGVQALSSDKMSVAGIKPV